jgi:hypothetical protein
MLETPNGAGIREGFPAENLDRDLASQLGVSGPIDLPHSARAERSNYFVGAAP